MRIFVCYRREDSAPWAGRIHDSLATRFGAANIFQDVATVRPGESFVEAMDDAVAQADAMLVVVGPRWLAPGEDGASRLSGADDYVRRELEAALSHGNRLVPVLVGGATMPTVGQVPEGLRPIVTRQAVTLHDESWQTDMEDLAAALGHQPATAGPRGRRPLLVGGAVALVAALGVGWALTRGPDEPPAGGAAGAGSVTTSDTRYPECVSPRGSAWRDLGKSSLPTLPRDGTWEFALTQAAYRPEGAATSLAVFELTATNRSHALQFLYSTGWSVIADSGFRQTCFSVLGGDNVSPGGHSTVLVGFVGAGPTSITAINAEQASGDTYRVNLQPAG